MTPGAVDLLEAFPSTPRWSDLEGQFVYEHELRAALRAPEPFQSALAELGTSLDRDSTAVSCTDCGEEWDAGTAAPAATDSDGRPCEHLRTTTENRFTIRLAGLEDLITSDLQGRWGIANVAWLNTPRGRELRGEVASERVAFVLFPASQQPDPTPSLFLRASPDAVGSTWTLPDVYWVDLLRPHRRDALLASLQQGGIADIAEWPETRALERLESATLLSLIRDYLRRAGAEQVGYAKEILGILEAVLPRGSYEGYRIGDARLFLCAADKDAVPWRCVVLAGGSLAARERAIALVRGLRAEITQWLDRRAHLIPLFIAFGSIKGIVSAFSVSAASFGASVVGGIAGGTVGTTVQIGSMVVGVTLVLTLVAYGLWHLAWLRRPFTLPVDRSDR